jgi:hypothetical protein
MEKTRFSRRRGNNRNLLIAILVAVLVVLFAIIANLATEMGIVENLLMCWIMTTAYSVFAFFIMTTDNVLEVKREVVREVPVVREIIKEVPIQIPMENTVYEVVEKPVYVDREVIKEVPVEVPVYFEKPRKKLNIPKYEFVGSSETKTFHKRSCRFGKLIKKKYKLNSNNKDFFKNRKFKVCKVCIRK